MFYAGAAGGVAPAAHATAAQDPELFEQIAAASLNSLYDLSPHSLSDIITAFVRARDPQAETVRATAKAFPPWGFCGFRACKV